MNLLICTDCLGVGGLERQLIAISKELSKRDIHVSLASLHIGGDLQEEARVYVDQLYAIIRPSKLSVSPFIQFYKIFKVKHVSVVYSFSTLSLLYCFFAAKIMKIKVVNGTIRHAGVSKGIDYLVNFILVHLSDWVVANSFSGLRYFRAGYRSSVIYNYIDIDRCNKSCHDLHKVVMTANMHLYKDHQTFIYAMKRLIDEGRVSSVGLIGDGPRRIEYERLVDTLGLGKVTKFYGLVANVTEILSEYGIGVLSSTVKYREGNSNALLEYMASGLIAVGSNVGGTVEIIHNGENGFLFEAENSDSLVEAIRMIQDAQLNLDLVRTNAVRCIRENHDPNTNSQKLVEIITKL